MAYTIKKLARGNAGGDATTTLYTAPASTTTLIKQMYFRITPDASPIFTLSIGGEVYYSGTITTFTEVTINCFQVLDATNTISVTMTGSASDVYVYHIGGIEIT